MRIQSAAVFAIAMVPVIAAAQQFLTAPGAPADPNIRFDVVAIRPIKDASGPMLIRMTPGGLESSVPVGVILRQALQKPDYQMVGAPGWINTERYSIRATVPAGTPPTAMSVMMLNLLKDRFQLATHLETREQPIFNLVRTRSDGRLGPNLKATSAECQATLEARRAAPPPGAPGRGGPPLPGTPGGSPLIFDPNACGAQRRGPGTAGAVGKPIAEIVPILSDLTGRLVFDKTGLKGYYDFTLKFALQPGGSEGPFGSPPGTPAPAIDPDAPNIFTAVQEQLGLKLEGARGPVEVVVIDEFEKPTLD